jgi:hypothetical protein
MSKKTSIVSSPGFIVTAVVIVIGMFVVLRLLSQ